MSIVQFYWFSSIKFRGEYVWLRAERPNPLPAGALSGQQTGGEVKFRAGAMLYSPDIHPGGDEVHRFGHGAGTLRVPECPAVRGIGCDIIAAVVHDLAV